MIHLSEAYARQMDFLHYGRDSVMLSREGQEGIYVEL